MHRHVTCRVPDAHSARTLLWRGLVVWAAVRATVTVFASLLQSPGSDSVLVISPPALLGVILVTVVLGWLETRRQHEVRFLANLGVGPAAIVGTLLTPALVGELLCAMVAR